MTLDHGISDYHGGEEWNEMSVRQVKSNLHTSLALDLNIAWVVRANAVKLPMITSSILVDR
jgi:hypothetical protein